LTITLQCGINAVHNAFSWWALIGGNVTVAMNGPVFVRAVDGIQMGRYFALNVLYLADTIGKDNTTRIIGTIGRKNSEKRAGFRIL